MSDEFIVLLDDNWQVIGHAPKLATHHHDTPLHLAFTCYAFDTRGRFLLTQRAWTKKTWPGVWTNSCCGHPAPGEPLYAAVARRLIAELGVDATRMDVVLGAVRYRAVMDNGIVENEVGPVVRALLTTHPDPNPEEVADIAWLPWHQLVASVGHRSCTLSPWTVITVEKLIELGPDPLAWPAVPPQQWLHPLRIVEPYQPVKGA